MLSGTLEDAARTTDPVLQELGLFREEQPARLAGNVLVRRERGAFVLDRPYGALPPSTAIGLGSVPSMVLTIENQTTTFHVEARRRCDSDALLIYSAGMPSPAWRRMYVTLLWTYRRRSPCGTGAMLTRAGSGLRPILRCRGRSGQDSGAMEHAPR